VLNTQVLPPPGGFHVDSVLEICLKSLRMLRT